MFQVYANFVDVAEDFTALRYFFTAMKLLSGRSEVSSRIFRLMQGFPF